jgi:hypothetical protein
MLRKCLNPRDSSKFFLFLAIVVPLGIHQTASAQDARSFNGGYCKNVAGWGSVWYSGNGTFASADKGVSCSTRLTRVEPKGLLKDAALKESIAAPLILLPSDQEAPTSALRRQIPFLN